MLHISMLRLLHKTVILLGIKRRREYGKMTSLFYWGGKILRPSLTDRLGITRNIVQLFTLRTTDNYYFKTVSIPAIKKCLLLFQMSRVWEIHKLQLVSLACAR